MLSNSAEELKQKGNEFYKQLKLEESLKMFQEASSLDPENPIYFSNQAAVLYELGKYENCLNISEKALKLNPNFELKSKLLSRICRSHFQLENFSQCLEIIEILKTLNQKNEFENYENISKERIQNEIQPIKNLTLLRNRLVASFDYLPVSKEQPNSLLQSIHSDKEPHRIYVENVKTDEMHFLFDNSGDVRNILETCLDFKVQLENEKMKIFKGINMHMNDMDKRIIARNVLILFLCSQTSLDDSNPNYIQGFNFIYNIWISVNLISPFYSNLIKILQILVDLSSSFNTWNSSENTKFLQFENEQDLKDISEIWKDWINDDRSLQEIMHSVKKMENSPNFTPEMKSKFYETKMKSIPQGEAFQQEMDYFIKTYMILPLPNLPDSNPNQFEKWKANPTLSIPSDVYAGIPPIKLKPIQQISNEPDSLLKSNSPIYKSVQSFAMGSSLMIMMYAQSLQILKNHGLNILITTHDVDSLYSLHFTQFDRIHTTELIESYGLLNIILKYVSMLKDSPHSSFQTDLPHYYKYYKDADHLVYSLLRIDSVQDLESIMGLTYEGFVNTYLRWSFKKPKNLVSKKKLHSWLHSVFLLIVHPSLRNPNSVIIEQPCLTLYSFIQLCEYLVEKVGYPIHYINEVLETILSGTLSTTSQDPEYSPEKQLKTKDVTKRDVVTRQYNFELSLLLSNYKFKSILISIPQKLKNCFGYFQIRPAVFQMHNYQHSLGIIMLKNCEKFPAKKFIEIEGNLTKKIESMGKDCQVLSNFKFFDFNHFEIVLPEIEFDKKDTEFILYRLDVQMIISQPTNIQSLKIL
jgi:tetratricopeptide (TPR) repeat protein